MSGTSLDGLDLAECFFTVDEAGNWHYRLGKLHTLAYPSQWENKLKNATARNEDQLKLLDIEYARFTGEAARLFSEGFYEDLDALCSHGHTVFHQPERGYTYQLGNNPDLSEAFGKTVVCDFRAQDVALGGQGAPLVPIGDALLFLEYDYCLNLGGFANVSYAKNGARIAYDICPVNFVLNRLALMLGRPYDAGGEMAAMGTVYEPLLHDLNALDFYRTTPPKSLGWEWVRDHVLPLIESAPCSVHDTLRTFTEHVATQLALQFEPGSSILVTGGGAYNKFLMERLASQKSLRIVIPSPALIEFKEALIFGFLGVLRLRGEANCLASVTGASSDHSSGSIFTVK